MITFVLVYGAVFAFLAGGYLIGRLLIDRWHEKQMALQTARLFAYEKMLDGAKAQFRSAIGAMPEKIGKQAKEMVDYWLKEEIEASKLNETGEG